MSQGDKNENDDTIPSWVIILILCIIVFIVLFVIYYRFTYSSRRSSSSSPKRTTTYSSSPIRFYDRDQPYYQFTNFWSSPIVDPTTRDKFLTNEHYFQAQKFGFDKNVYNSIRNEPRARGALQRAANHTNYIRKQHPRLYDRWVRWWIDDSARIDVMKRALHLKFTQHKDLRKLLLHTGNRKLVEHTRNDNFWGDGGDGNGKNMLGKLLMELRHNLRMSNHTKPPTFKPFTRD